MIPLLNSGGEGDSTVRRTSGIKVLTALTAVALTGVACGEPPSEQSSQGGGDFTGCMVTDSGGADDKSFNERSYDGLQQAKNEGLIGDVKITESSSAGDFVPNTEQMVKADCGLIVTVGFLLGDATKDAAEANPEEKFAIVDFQHADSKGKPTPIKNVKPLVFNTHEAAFQAGYLAAGYSKTGKVATWGGQKIPSVTIFMDGFADGVAHYNKTKKKNVQVLGWNKKKQDGQFVGDFENSTKAKQVSTNLLNSGADVILPVAGPLAEQSAVAAKANKKASVIWVDADGVKAAPKYKDVILTSVEKSMDLAVKEAAKATAEDKFSNEPYVGDLENDGVKLAPYHEFDGKVDAGLKKEVADLKQQIVDGKIKVSSDAAF